MKRRVFPFVLEEKYVDNKNNETMHLFVFTPWKGLQQQSCRLWMLQQSGRAAQDQSTFRCDYLVCWRVF